MVEYEIDQGSRDYLLKNLNIVIQLLIWIGIPVKTGLSWWLLLVPILSIIANFILIPLILVGLLGFLWRTKIK